MVGLAMAGWTANPAVCQRIAGISTRSPVQIQPSSRHVRDNSSTLNSAITRHAYLASPLTWFAERLLTMNTMFRVSPGTGTRGASQDILNTFLPGGKSRV